MTDSPKAPSKHKAAIPADDPRRNLTVADADSPKLRHISIAGDTYTILISLPIVAQPSSDRSGRDFWAVKRTGDYTFDCSLGEGSRVCRAR